MRVKRKKEDDYENSIWKLFRSLRSAFALRSYGLKRLLDASKVVHLTREKCSLLHPYWRNGKLLFMSLRLPTDSEPDEANRQHAHQSSGSIHTGKLRKGLTMTKGVLRSPAHFSNSPSKRASRGSNGRLCLRRGAGVFRANEI